MIYPIVAYGNPILKKESEEIREGEDVKGLIKDMFETMGLANGVGLAAPQINKASGYLSSIAA
jgi:peptide deformylase